MSASEEEPVESDRLDPEPGGDGRLTRSTLLRGAMAGGLALAAPGLLAACGGSSSPSSSAAAAGTPNPAASCASRWSAAARPRRSTRMRPCQNIDSARATNLFDRLVRVSPDQTLSMDLAESMEPNADATAMDGQVPQGRRMARRRAVRPPTT